MIDAKTAWEPYTPTAADPWDVRALIPRLAAYAAPGTINDRVS